MSVMFRNIVLMPLFFLSGFLVGQLREEELSRPDSQAAIEAVVLMNAKAEGNCIDKIQRSASRPVNSEQHISAVVSKSTSAENAIALSFGISDSQAMSRFTKASIVPRQD